MDISPRAVVALTDFAVNNTHVREHDYEAYIDLLSAIRHTLRNPFSVKRCMGRVNPTPAEGIVALQMDFPVRTNQTVQDLITQALRQSAWNVVEIHQAERDNRWTTTIFLQNVKVDAKPE